jgi:hypothetical protein
MENKFLQENGFLDDNTGKISLADKLEGKTKQYVNSHMVAKPNLTMEEFHKYLQNVIDSKLDLRQKVVAVERYIKQITGR